MTRKQRRATLIGFAVGGLSLATVLVMFALRSGVDYFYTPSRVVAREVGPGVNFRLGGLVAKGSVQRGQGTAVSFDVTDTKATVPVVFEGILPELFREGQGIITVGKLEADGRFRATSVLAKHDENYMPPEVAKSLKEQGVWQGQTAGQASAPKAGTKP
jgi:cytochrome c-type biogenesis protein CcmE